MKHDFLFYIFILIFLGSDMILCIQSEIFLSTINFCLKNLIGLELRLNLGLEFLN